MASRLDIALLDGRQSSRARPRRPSPQRVIFAESPENRPFGRPCHSERNHRAAQEDRVIPSAAPQARGCPQTAGRWGIALVSIERPLCREDGDSSPPPALRAGSARQDNSPVISRVRSEW